MLRNHIKQRTYMGIALSRSGILNGCVKSGLAIRIRHSRAVDDDDAYNDEKHQQSDHDGGRDTFCDMLVGTHRKSQDC